MINEISFYDQYKSFVKTADNIKARPAQIEEEAKLAINDVECYCNHFQHSLPELEEYPLLIKSLFDVIGKKEMMGFLGVFIIDDAIVHIHSYTQQEQEIRNQIDGMRDIGDQSVLQELTEKAHSWRRIITINNIDYVGRFLLSLRKQVDELYESLSANEKLGRALAKSEEDRRRLIELEESRQRGISEREMSREEKRQKAREEYAKSIRIRKKK